jgi:hypothetical protein
MLCMTVSIPSIVEPLLQHRVRQAMRMVTVLVTVMLVLTQWPVPGEAVAKLHQPKLHQPQLSIHS